MEAYPMTKAELVDQVAARVDLTKRDTEIVVDTILDSIAQALTTPTDGKVELRGFGSFRVRQRRPRRARNPQDGTSVQVPAKRVPYFRVGKELRAWLEA
jgi:integration host factor subunit beta